MSISDLIASAVDFRCKGVCPHDSCLLAIIRAARQGVVYGAKLRFPHALVMTVLFSKSTPTIQSKIIAILRATYTNGKSLGMYAALYKALTCLLRYLRQHDDNWNALIAGGLAGSYVFGTNTGINAQINMYVMSRVILGSLRFATQNGKFPEWENNRGYKIFAALVWASVMVLFETRASCLQPSLASSMQYLYKDSDKQPTGVSVSERFIDWIVAGVD